jgi:hypothetical protein
MRANWGRAALLTCLAIPACGPALDLYGCLPGLYGPYTPGGKIKHDFWGNSYIEPYKDGPRRNPVDTYDLTPLANGAPADQADAITPTSPPSGSPSVAPPTASP